VPRGIHDSEETFLVVHGSHLPAAQQLSRANSLVPLPKGLIKKSDGIGNFIAALRCGHGKEIAHSRWK
jgi:hypothetical protein